MQSDPSAGEMTLLGVQGADGVTTEQNFSELHFSPSPHTWSSASSSWYKEDTDLFEQLPRRDTETIRGLEQLCY